MRRFHLVSLFGCSFTTFTTLATVFACTASTASSTPDRPDAGNTESGAGPAVPETLAETLADAALEAFPDAGQNKPPVSGEFRVLYGAEQPLSKLATGRVVPSKDGKHLLCATQSGVAKLDLAGKTLREFTLPAQNQAPAVSALATRTGSPDVFFMTQGFDAMGDGTLGSIDTNTGVVRQRGTILDTGLGSILLAPIENGTSDALWTVDPAADPPAVFAYKFSEMVLGAGEGVWRPDPARRVALPKLDLDGNNRDEIVLPTNMLFLAPNVAVVSFDLAPAPANTVGGLFFFDPSTALPLATMLVPARMGATGGTLMETVVANGRLFVVADEGNTDAKYNFIRIQGTVSVYDLPIKSFIPEGADNTARIVAPRAQFATSTDHPVALSVFDDFVVAMTFPSKRAAALDLIDLAGTQVVRSLSLGVVNPGKGREPRRMERSGNRLYIGTDQGLLVAGTQ